MKKLLILITAVALAAIGLALRAQTVTVQTATTYSIPPVNWTGADAQVIAIQMLSATNSSGAPALGITNFVPGTFYVILQINADAQGNLQSITASGHQ